MLSFSTTGCFCSLLWDLPKELLFYNNKWFLVVTYSPFHYDILAITYESGITGYYWGWYIRDQSGTLIGTLIVTLVFLTGTLVGIWLDVTLVFLTGTLVGTLVGIWLDGTLVFLTGTPVGTWFD